MQETIVLLVLIGFIVIVMIDVYRIDWRQTRYTNDVEGKCDEINWDNVRCAEITWDNVHCADIGSDKQQEGGREMIKVTCDMCGCEIDYDLNGVNLNFNHYGVVNFGCSKGDSEYQLCNVCATKVKKFVDKEGEKNGKIN